MRFRQEWGVELRRHAGNPRLPPALRDRLRAGAKRALGGNRREPALSSPRPEPRVEPRPVAFEGGQRPERALSRILFVMLQPGFIRYFEDALLALAGAGHHVHLAFEIDRDKLGESGLARRLASASPHITIGAAPPRLESVRDFLARSDRTATRSGRARRPGVRRRDEAWASLATTVRLLADYLRFFDPAFAHATRLRERAEKRLPRVYVPVVRVVAAAGGWARRACAALLRGVESGVPTDPGVERFVREHQPDLLMVTPLIELGSQQVDYVKCARRLGIRSVLPVASWDNLTSKGLVRVAPDHVIVWNDAQKTEAVTLHDVAADRVITTGAQVFDRWFAARPSRSRDEFCRAVGLDPSRPFVLYVGSSTFIAPDEVPFARQWIAAIRRSENPAVASAGLLLRPHPANARQWEALDTAEWPQVAMWPSPAAAAVDPTAAEAQRDYFDSLYFCAAVVGINTSAQIEAAIVGRPVLTVQAPEFAHSQGGTLHFHHLVDEGAVRSAGSLDEHVRQLAEALSGNAGGRAMSFVRSFVRPHGIDVPASPIFAREIARLAALPSPAPRRDGVLIRAGRPLLLAAAFVSRALADDRPLWAYALRPLVTMGVSVLAAWYRGRMALNHARVWLRRRGRMVWKAWYESSQSTRKQWRRAKKSAVRWLGSWVAR